jgi:hypothetical protein
MKDSLHDPRDAANPMPSSPNYVITLVHGTFVWPFVRNAEWINENSVLRTSLDNALPGLIRFEKFLWSGRNSVTDRHAASEALKDLLVKQLRLYPNAKHYVIAHSHGGNILMYALRDRELERHIRGIVCLSTPFLHVTKRNLGKGMFTLKHMLMALIIIFAICFILLPVFYLALIMPNDMLELCILLIGTVLLGLVVYHTGSLATTLCLQWENEAEKCLLNAQIARIQNEKVLIVRTAGDEATWILALSSLASWIGNRMIELIANLQKKLSKILPAGWLGDILASLPTIFIFIPIMIAWPVFGLRLGISSVLLDIDAEAVPPGSWSLHYLYPNVHEHSTHLNQVKWLLDKKY